MYNDGKQIVVMMVFKLAFDVSVYHLNRNSDGDTLSVCHCREDE